MLSHSQLCTYILCMTHGGVSTTILGNSCKVILRTKEECSFALKTEVDGQDAVKVGILGLDPLHKLPDRIGQFLVL